MTITFVPLSARGGNGARPSRLRAAPWISADQRAAAGGIVTHRVSSHLLHPLPDRVDHPSPLLLLADDPQLGQGGQELGGRGVRGDQDAGAGGGREDGDDQNFSHHDNTVVFFAPNGDAHDCPLRWRPLARSAS